MKSVLKTIFAFLPAPIDGVLSILIIPAALTLLKYRQLGSAKLPQKTEFFSGLLGCPG